MNAEERSRKILQRFYRNGLGVSADSIKKYQGNELPTFGIVYPELKEILRNEEPDNKLSNILLQKNTREARIAAFILCKPDELSISDLSKMQHYTLTGELKNIFARHVISHYPGFIDSLKEIMKEINIDLVLKAVIQYYRQFKDLPASDTCINILNARLMQNSPLLSDGENFALAVYQHYKSHRGKWKESLVGLTKTFPPFKEEITGWIRDFKYVE